MPAVPASGRKYGDAEAYVAALYTFDRHNDRKVQRRVRIPWSSFTKRRVRIVPKDGSLEGRATLGMTQSLLRRELPDLEPHPVELARGVVATIGHDSDDAARVADVEQRIP